MELVIDYRETSLCEALTKISVQFKQENLLLGDILFRLDNKAIAIIERKTLADYAASHLTNRYREQRARLQTARAEGTYIAYLLEGGWQYPPNERVWGPCHPRSEEAGPATGRNVTEKMLRTLAYRLQFKYKIPIIQTLNVQESARNIEHLLAILTEDPTYFKETPEDDLAVARAATATTGNFSARRKDNVPPAASMLMGLHGMSLTKAEAILAAVPTITDLCQKTKEEIANIPAGKGRIGPKLGADIFAALH
jgi:ERCC4-type nuclease